MAAVAPAMAAAAAGDELVGKAVLNGVGELRLFRAATCGAVLLPGQELYGRVEFHCVKASLFVRGIWVKLVGRQTLAAVGASSAVTVDLFEGNEDHYLGGFHDVLYGFGEEDEAGGTLFELHEGVHRWNFAFKVPEGAPPSYCDAFTEVAYTATCVFDSPEVPMAVGQINYTAVVTAASAAVNHRGADDVVALGAAPSLSYRQRPTRAFFGLGCLGGSSASSSSGSSGSHAAMPTADNIARMLDAPARSSSLSSRHAPPGPDPATRHAHTAMRVALSGDDGARGRCPGSSVAFDFDFVETTVKVDCSLATVCTGKPISIEARLLVCVVLRADSKAPFRTVRSLLRAPAVHYGPPPAVGPSKGPLLHVLQRVDDAKKSKAAGARKWFSNKWQGDGAEHDAGPWGACHAHPLWSRAVILQAPEQPLAPVAVQFDVPVKVNPFVRATCLADWPKPSPLPHGEHGAILNYTTKGAPLSEYRVILEVTAFELKGDIDVLYNDRGFTTSAAADKTNAKTPLCRPCYAEIEIRPPAPSRPVSAPPGARCPLRAAADAAEHPHPHPHPRGASPQLPVADAAVGAPMLPPRPRRRSASVVPAGDLEVDAGAGASRSHRPSSASVAPVAGGGGAPAPATSAEAAAASLSLGVAGVPRDRTRPAPATDADDTENVHPNAQAATASVAAAAPTKTVKAATPHARAVRHVPKVKAELVSRGPAAVLRDRTAPIHRDVQITPQRFAPAVPIAHGAVVVLDDLVTTTANAAEAPTAARATITVNVGTPGGDAMSPRGGVMSPSDPTSPALAFLCSPRTTELLLQQELEANERLGGSDIERGTDECGSGAIAIAEYEYEEAAAVSADGDAGDAGDEAVVAAAAAAVVALEDLPSSHDEPDHHTHTPGVRPRLDCGGCATGLVVPFQLPPDTAPATVRGRERECVVATTTAAAAGGAGAHSPWVAGVTGVHFTQNGRRLSFSNLADGDAVSEFVEPALSPAAVLRV